MRWVVMLSLLSWLACISCSDSSEPIECGTQVTTVMEQCTIVTSGATVSPTGCPTVVGFTGSECSGGGTTATYNRSQSRDGDRGLIVLTGNGCEWRPCE